MDHTGVATAQRGIHFPGPSCSDAWALPKRIVPDESCVSCTSQVQATKASRCTVSSQSQVGHVFHMISRSKPAPNCSVSWVCHACTVLGGPCISSGWLLSICDTPGRYDPSRIPGLVKRQPSHSLVADAVSVASLEQILAFCLWLSCTCLSASREAGFLSFGIC